MSSPFVLVIFGATGDLMRRKLTPALNKLYEQTLISPDVSIIGVGRREFTDSAFATEVGASVSVGKRLQYVQGLFEDAALYAQLTKQLLAIDQKVNACVPRFFYLATPPSHYETILDHLDSSTLAEGCGQGTVNFTRLLIEKPFGKDLETAEKLEKKLSHAFLERQIYRIDHYLGKETVQNILAFRFGNGMFEPTWNAQFIDHVQITFAEDIAVGTRGQSYDGVGALRDVVQNHILQMLALTAMEQPRGFTADSVREARVNVMKALDLMDEKEVQNQVVMGQYDGYMKEKGVIPESTTETFVALKAFVHTPRWKGVPFYIRTGKAMPKKATEISLHFKKPVCPDDMCLFNPDLINRNVLTLKIDPDEGIVLRLMVKKPGFGMDFTQTQMKFHYEDAFGLGHPDAYQRLFLDAIRGDQTLFASTAEISASWKFMMSILNGLPSAHAPLSYEKKSWGPKEAIDLIERDGRHWFLSEK